MPTFGEIMSMLAALNDKTNGQMEWSIDSNGNLNIKAYVGIENHDLYKQAREMFAPNED